MNEPGHAGEYLPVQTRAVSSATFHDDTSVLLAVASQLAAAAFTAPSCCGRAFSHGADDVRNRSCFSAC